VIKGLDRSATEILLGDRRSGGPFASMDDLVARCPASPPLLLRLALAGALDSLFPQAPSPGRRRAAAIWAAHRYWESAGGLFDATPREAEGPEFPGMNEWDLMLNQFRRTAYSVDRHPLEFFRQGLTAQGYRDSRQVEDLKDGAVFRCGGLVITRQRPGTAKGMLFLTLEDEFGFLNLAVDPAGQRRFGEVLLDESLVGLKVRLGRVDEARSLKAVEAWPLGNHEKISALISHDFC
jgi:error-prone DNA polymerase